MAAIHEPRTRGRWSALQRDVKHRAATALTFLPCFDHIARVGPHCSRPADPRHIAQALHLARWRAEGFWRMSNPHKSLVRKAAIGHAITARSAALQPSVISNSVQEMRDVRYQDVCDHRSGSRAR